MYTQVDLARELHLARHVALVDASRATRASRLAVAAPGRAAVAPGRAGLPPGRARRRAARLAVARAL